MIDSIREKGYLGFWRSCILATFGKTVILKYLLLFVCGQIHSIGLINRVQKINCKGIHSISQYQYYFLKNLTFNVLSLSCNLAKTTL